MIFSKEIENEPFHDQIRNTYRPTTSLEASESLIQRASHDWFENFQPIMITPAPPLVAQESLS